MEIEIHRDTERDGGRTSWEGSEQECQRTRRKLHDLSWQSHCIYPSPANEEGAQVHEGGGTRLHLPRRVWQGPMSEGELGWEVLLKTWNTACPQRQPTVHSFRCHPLNSFPEGPGAHPASFPLTLSPENLPQVNSRSDSFFSILFRVFYYLDLPLFLKLLSYLWNFSLFLFIFFLFLFCY